MVRYNRSLWSNAPMDEITLMLLVQQYEELYNLKHQHYMNVQRRENIWEEIGEQMNQSGLVCKERWTRIRDNYRKALTLRKTKSGPAASKIKPPKYHQELSFLNPYINDEENRLWNISTTALKIEQDTLSPCVDSPGEDSRHSESPLPRSTPTHIYRHPSPYRSADNPTSSVATVLKDFLEKQGDVPPRNCLQNNINTDQDPLIDFFISMARTVKGFNKKKQLEIKGKLFQLVHSAELEMLDDEDDTTAPSEMINPQVDLPNSLVSNSIL